MVKVLVADNELCTGCGICELACSLRWFKVFNPKRSAIRAVKLEPGIDAVVYCTQCGLCINACPVGAISRDPKTRVVKIDWDKCTGCGDCVMACPYGAVFVDPVVKKAVKCDTCGGDPECVKRCPQSVLRFVDLGESVLFKQRETARSKAAAPHLARKLWYRPPFR